jgi:two-component system cell cycle response regulator
LLDVMMPGMDGLEVCRKIRAELRTKEVPIVMVTALGDQASRLAGFEAGADGYVSKPFNLVELRSRVGAIIRLNRYRRLADQQQQFQWIVEQATEGYLIVNAVDEILFANPSARRWLGLPPDRGDGASEGTFLAAVYRGLTVASHSPELWRDWPDVPAATLALPRFLVSPETREAKAFFIEVSLFENTEGRLLRLRDVSERMGVQRGQRSFQIMMSHKLLTPLNGILGPLEMLAESEEMEAKEHTELTTMVHDSAKRLVGAVEDVVRFTGSSIRPALGERFALTGLSELVGRVAAGLGLPPVTVSVADETHAACLGCAPEVLEWVLFELFENAKSACHGVTHGHDPREPHSGRRWADTFPGAINTRGNAVFPG